MTTLWVSGLGDDTTGDGTEGLPYRLPSKALSVASAADIINVVRGYTYAGTCLISLNSITIQAVGEGARPLFRNAAGHGIEIADGVTGTTLRSLQSDGNNTHGINLGEGISGIAIDCHFTNNVSASANGVRTKTAAVGGTFTFRGCVASGNDNDGFATFGSFIMECWYCVAFGNAGAAASDGFTNHDTSAMRMWFCESYGNSRGVAFVSDNGAGASWLVGCYIHDSVLPYEFVSSATGGSGAHVNPDYLVGCAFVPPATDPSGTNIVRFNGVCKGRIWNCTFYNPNVGAVTTQSLDIGSSAGGRVGWSNCRFVSANDNDARHIRTSTSPATQVEFANYNAYDSDTGNKWNIPASTAFAAWKLLSDFNATLLDANSTQAADAVGVPFAYKDAFKLPATSALRGAGTAIDAAIVALGLNYDLFGREITSATPDIGAAQYVAPAGGRVGVGGFLWSLLLE